MSDQDKDHDHGHCLEMFKKLSEYIDGELDQLNCEELENHLSDCPTCKICMITLKQTVNLCKEVKDNPVPESFSDKMTTFVEGLQKVKDGPLPAKPVKKL